MDHLLQPKPAEFSNVGNFACDFFRIVLKSQVLVSVRKGLEMRETACALL